MVTAGFPRDFPKQLKKIIDKLFTKKYDARTIKKEISVAKCKYK